MIGPSNRVLIVMGARYQPCMRSLHGVQDAVIPPLWPCPNTTTTDENSPDMKCTLSQVCGFSGVPEPRGGGSVDDLPQPNQWFRFIIPMFLHAGIIHISFNMLLQLTLGRDMEKVIGPLRFALVYFSSGIFGFVLGGNFAASGQSSRYVSGRISSSLVFSLSSDMTDPSTYLVVRLAVYLASSPSSCWTFSTLGRPESLHTST